MSWRREKEPYLISQPDNEDIMIFIFIDEETVAQRLQLLKISHLLNSKARVQT